MDVSVFHGVLQKFSVFLMVMPELTMTKAGNLNEVSEKVEKLHTEEEKLLLSSKEWLAFVKSYDGFRKSAFKASLPFDPRFNAVHWGFGVNGLCREIAFGYCWMNAYATYYKNQTLPSAKPPTCNFMCLILQTTASRESIPVGTRSL